MTSLLRLPRSLLSKGSLTRQVSVVAGGTLIAQAMNMLAAPFLARLYSPAAFGELGVFLSLVSVLSVIASLKYEAAIPVANSDAESWALARATLFVAIVVSSLVALGTALWGEDLTTFLHVPGLQSSLWMLPVGLLAFVMYQVSVSLGTRYRRFGLVSVSTAAQNAAQVAWQLLGGAVGWGTGGLVAAYAFTRPIGALPFVGRLPRDRGGERWWRAARRYGRFATYTAPQGLLNVIGILGAPLLLARYFSPREVGFFAVDIRFLSIPMVLVGQAVAQVFYPHAAALNLSERGADRFVERTATRLLVFGLPVFALIGLVGPVAFAAALGERWREAGVYAQLLAPSLAVGFISSPLSGFAFVKRRQRTAFFISLYETALRVGAVMAGGWLSSPRLSVALYSLAGVVISLVYVAWVLRLAGSSIKRVIRGKARYLLTLLAVTAGLASLSRLAPGAFSAGVSLALLGAIWLWGIATDAGQPT